MPPPTPAPFAAITGTMATGTSAGLQQFSRSAHQPTAPRHMNTTTAPAASQAVGGILDAAQLAWDRSDWIDALQQGCEDTYASSVIWASDDGAELNGWDLRQLLEAHGFTCQQLLDDLSAVRAAGHPVASPCHAGQALIWLGY